MLILTAVVRARLCKTFLYSNKKYFAGLKLRYDVVADKIVVNWLSYWQCRYFHFLPADYVYDGNFSCVHFTQFCSFVGIIWEATKQMVNSDIRIYDNKFTYFQFWSMRPNRCPIWAPLLIKYCFNIKQVYCIEYFHEA